MADVLHPESFFLLPENPAPRGIVAGSFETRDKIRLRYAVCPSSHERARGTIVLLQGRNECIEKYFETIGDLSARGFMVATFDWRGQGGSGRLARGTLGGHVASFDDYVEDLNSFLQTVVLPDCRGPYAILAHSMGGLVSLRAMPLLSNRIERLVLSAPLVGLPERRIGTRGMLVLTTLMRLSGMGGTRVRPQPRAGRLDSLAENALTSDAVRHQRNLLLISSAPQLFVRNPTAAWLRAALLAMRQLDHSDVIARMQVPTLFVTAPGDRVVATPAAERLAWRMRSGHHLSLPGARHELMQEAERHRDPFLAAFEAFVGGALPMHARQAAS